MGAILTVLLRVLTNIGLLAKKAGGASIAAIVAFVTWLCMRITDRALAFFAAYAVTILVLYRACKAVYDILYSLVSQQFNFSDVWQATTATGSWLSYLLIEVCDIPYIIELITRAFGFYASLLAIRVLVFRFRWLRNLAGVVMK